MKASSVEHKPYATSAQHLSRIENSSILFCIVGINSTVRLQQERPNPQHSTRHKATQIASRTRKAQTGFFIKRPTLFS